jgi:predicted MFS family arabinose efflux permease
MEVGSYKPNDRSRAEAGNETRRAGKGLILVVTMLPQTVTAMVSLAPPVMADQIATTLGLSPKVAGLYVALVYVGAVISSSFTASLITRLGPLRTSFACVVGGGLGLSLMAVPHLATALLATAIIGLSYRPLTPASSHVLARYRTTSAIAFLVSVRQTSVPLGGALAGVVAPPLVIGIGWNTACATLGLATAALGAVLWLSLRIVRNEPPEPPHGHGSSLLEPARFILRSPDLTVLAVSSMVYAAMQLVLSSFLVIYLTSVTGTNLVLAGALLSASQLAGVAGRLAWGFLADRAHSPRMVLVAIAVLMAIATALMGLFSPSWPFAGLATVVIVVGGTASGWNGVYLAEIMSDVKPAEAGLATAGSLMFTYLGIIFGPVLFGILAAQFGYAHAYFAMAAAVMATGLLMATARRMNRHE